MVSGWKKMADNFIIVTLIIWIYVVAMALQNGRPFIKMAAIPTWFKPQMCHRLNTDHTLCNLYGGTCFSVKTEM